MTSRKRKNYSADSDNSIKKPKYEDKKFEIIRRVQSQAGIRGQLIIFGSSMELPFTILHNAVDRIKGTINVRSLGHDLNKEDDSCKFQFLINNEVIAEGTYRTEAVAKKGLSELALSSLKKSCFTIFRKILPRDSPKVSLTSPTSSDTSSKNLLPETSSTVGGIGAKMMQRMGWGGKGLGAQEQGRTDIVQPYIQIQRQGLGTTNIVQEVRNVLGKYAASHDLNSIAFSPEFTKDERATIHEVARKFHLVSKSYGQGSDRMIVVRSKIKPWDLISSLLEAGGETEQLKLIWPTDFDK